MMKSPRLDFDKVDWSGVTTDWRVPSAMLCAVIAAALVILAVSL